jgi:hypothetical protein
MIRVLPLLGLLACTPDDLADTDPGLPTAPTAPVSACTETPHAWRPFAEVGHIVSAEPAPDLTLPGVAIDIALRQNGLEAFTPVPHGVRSWRVRYLTQDKGRIVETTGVISVPDVDEPVEAPVVVWAHGTTGFVDACAPSAGGVMDNAFVMILASQGYVGVAPDYLGMNGFGEPAEEPHAFLVPEPAATATLDGVRAAWALDDFLDGSVGVTPTRQVVLWGASEGGFVVLQADRYLTHYLPEAELLGTVALVPPSDLLGIARAASTTFSDATFGAVGGLFGHAVWLEDLGLVSQVLQSPWDQQVIDTATTTCDLSAVTDGVQTVEELFQPDILADARQGIWPAPFDCSLTEATLHRSPVPREHDAPVFFQVNGEDELVVADVIRQDAGRLCEAGYRLDYLECAGARHVDGVGQSLPVQLDWIRDRVDGVPVEAVCDLDDVQDCTQYLDL